MSEREDAMAAAIRTLNRLFDEATRDGFKVEADVNNSYRWAGTDAYCPFLSVTISRPVKL